MLLMIDDILDFIHIPKETYANSVEMGKYERVHIGENRILIEIGERINEQL